MMDILLQLCRRLLSSLRRRRYEREMEEEMRFHLEMQIEQNLDAGMAAEEARYAARRQFGNQTWLKEVSREMWSLNSFEMLRQDLVYGARMLLKNPGFTTVAVLTLALGIGANTAIFSVVHAVLLKTPPYRESDRLVMVWEEASYIGLFQVTPAPANYADWRAQNQVFEEMAALESRTFNLTSDGEPKKVSASGVTASLFPLLGANPVVGRGFLPADERPGAGNVAIISHRLWQDRYGADRNIAGRNVLLNDISYTVVGVMPAGFQFLDRDISVWVPITFTPEILADRNNHYFRVVARLKPGVTLEQANADVRMMMAQIGRAYPQWTDGGKESGSVDPLRDQLIGDVRRPLMILLIAVGFVLLISCTNVAGLLLARALARSREMAVRAALGAAPSRIARQLLTESLLLAGSGGILGALLAVWSFSFLKQLIPQSLALAVNLKLSLPVLLFTMAASALAGLIFGTAPALQAARVDFNEELKPSGGRIDAGIIHNRLRNLFVISEIALALILLTGAGLMIQTLYKLNRQFSALNPEKVLTLRTDLTGQKYRERAQRITFYDQVLERVRHLPGVVSAGYTTAAPLAGGGLSGIKIEGRGDEPGIDRLVIPRQVSAGYLQTMGIALRKGRYFDGRDNQQSTPVVIINETMARKRWPGESPIGKRVTYGSGDPQSHWRTVVGIVADVRNEGIDASVRAEMYLPYHQAVEELPSVRDLVVRSSGEPVDLVSAVSSAVHSVDPNQPISNVRTMDELLGQGAATRRLVTTLLAIFALLALLLACLGIYGMLSYFVLRRAPEIGVRLALGAQPEDILRLVLKKGMALVLIGVATGLAGALALTWSVRSLLFEVRTTDTLTFTAVALLVATVALAACWIPARRATKVDPLVALRVE
ncbi:MAG: ABC transporter permease [Blastocatellia bacterium]|nr:ABC transporter permease [Blastocatellia bacterium]